ncbi:MAG: histidinol dehydrogenase, partial [Chloroflexi bacterium]|nr:histidinol dehydrogenase [Chloroflexota bacterium]
MRILRGIDEARRFLATRRALTADQVVPEEVSQRIQDIFGRAMSPSEVVAHILQEVRFRGDDAVRELSARIDGVQLAELEVPRAEVQRAREKLPSELLAALELAAQRVHEFAMAALPKTWHDLNSGLGELVVPLERVGLYVPGGTAVYPSTVIMTAMTARAAGVKELVMCTPARDDGRVNPVVAAAAHIAAVDRVFRIGGAQAIAAMAYGTASVPCVDKVCGPGNIFVTLAKQQLYGQVGIDGLFGPTETVAVADDSTDPRLCAADLLAQAEHDILATPVLVTTSERLSQQVNEELARQVESLERRDIALKALEGQGVTALVKDVEEAVEVANLFAPEHLCLMVREPWLWLGKVQNAGTVFMGEQSPEVMGDYIAGPSHTIPTQGTARFASYLGVDQFLK